MSNDLENTNVTRLTLDTGENTITVEVPGVNLDVIEFMEIIELMMTSAPYSKEAIESYITSWAEEIKASKEN